MAGFGDILSSAIKTVLDNLSDAVVSKAEEIKQDVPSASEEKASELRLPTIKPVVPKISSIDIEEKSREEEKPSVFEAAGQDVEDAGEVREEGVKAAIDTVGSAAASAADAASGFLQHPVDTLLGMDEQWEADQRVKQEQSRGKFRGSLADDPEREAYLGTYQSLFANDPEYDPAGKSAATRMREASLDDGRDNNYDSLTSNTMTGEQYLRYREAGLPGRDVDDINPNSTYSKMDEYANFGFIPYAPDEDAVRGMQLQQAEQGPTRFFNKLSESRTDLNPYTFSVGGQTFSGNLFDDESEKYLREVQAGLDDPTSAYRDKDADHAGMTAYTPSQLSIAMDGEDEPLVVPARGAEVVKQPVGTRNADGTVTYDDPTFAIRFADGTVVNFADEEDYTGNVSPLGWEAAQDGDDVYFWAPDLQLSDGTAVPYPDAIKVALDESPEDASDGITYDFGALNLGRPQRFNEGIIGGGLENLPANFWDLLASSAPYFTWPTGVIRGASDAASAIQGLDPMTVGEDGVGKLAAQDMDDDRYLSNIAFNAAMPVTERIMGGIGGKSLFNLASPIERHLAGSAAMPIARWGAGVAGEGLEEVAGNAFEEAARQGIGGWYADPVRNEEGETAYDLTNHEVRDESTPFQQRLLNYLADAPDAIAGGMLLGGAMGLPSLARREIPAARGMWRDNREARERGLRPFREAGAEELEFELPDSLKAMYEREM